MLNFDFETYNNKYIDKQLLDLYRGKIKKIKEKFSNDELGHWTKLDTYISKEEFSAIKTAASNIREIADVFVVIGIGGSYMGSEAIIKALTPTYKKEKPEIIFLGKNINPNEYNEVFEYIKDKEIAVNVISKSGTTLEPSIAFDLMMKLMSEKYNDEELKKRVIVTTDKET